MGLKRVAQRSPFLPHPSVRPSLIIAVLSWMGGLKPFPKVFVPPQNILHPMSESLKLRLIKNAGWLFGGAEVISKLLAYGLIVLISRTLGPRGWDSTRSSFITSAFWVCSQTSVWAFTSCARLRGIIKAWRAAARCPWVQGSSRPYQLCRNRSHNPLPPEAGVDEASGSAGRSGGNVDVGFSRVCQDNVRF